MPRVAPVPPSVGSFITGQSLPNYVGSFITGQSCGGAVDDDMENIIVSQLLYLDAIDPNKDIVMYVNSPGGSLTAGINVNEHDIRFVEDNWESPVLGAWGLGWEIWMDGMEITQFTYFQQTNRRALATDE